MKTPILNAVDFTHSGHRFLVELTQRLDTLQIDTRAMLCDHLCFRVSTETEYEAYKTLLLNLGSLLIESVVNGRPIATFKLHSPIVTDHHSVHLIELPSPKRSSPYVTGFEHGEFVITESFNDFAKKHSALSFVFNDSNTQNPELVLKLAPSMQAKFHHRSLEWVIQQELEALVPAKH